MRKLLPFVALVACASNTREPAPRETTAGIDHATVAADRARDPRIEATPVTRVGPPSLSAEVELDAPVEDTAAGQITDATVTSDGTNFVFGWSASYGLGPNARGVRASRTYFARMTTTGA